MEGDRISARQLYGMHSPVDDENWDWYEAHPSQSEFDQMFHHDGLSNTSTAYRKSDLNLHFYLPIHSKFALYFSVNNEYSYHHLKTTTVHRQLPEYEVS